MCTSCLFVLLVNVDVYHTRRIIVETADCYIIPLPLVWLNTTIILPHPSVITWECACDRYIVNKWYDKLCNTSRKICTFALTFAGIISVIRCINECMNTSMCRNGSFIKPRCNGNKLIGARRDSLSCHPWSRGSNALSRRMVNGTAAPIRWQTLTMWIAAWVKHYEV